MNLIPNAGGREVKIVTPIFTRRQLEVIELSCQFLTNQEIADKLGIEEVTVKSHRKAIMIKLGIKGKCAMNKFIMTLKFN